jgi:hypothetical protein
VTYFTLIQASNLYDKKYYKTNILGGLNILNMKHYKVTFPAKVNELESQEIIEEISEVSNKAARRDTIRTRKIRSQ